MALQVFAPGLRDHGLAFSTVPTQLQALPTAKHATSTPDKLEPAAHQHFLTALRRAGGQPLRCTTHRSTPALQNPGEAAHPRDSTMARLLGSVCCGPGTAGENFSATGAGRGAGGQAHLHPHRAIAASSRRTNLVDDPRPSRAADPRPLPCPPGLPRYTRADLLPPLPRSAIPPISTDSRSCAAGHHAMWPRTHRRALTGGPPRPLRNANHALESRKTYCIPHVGIPSAKRTRHACGSTSPFCGFFRYSMKTGRIR